MEQAARLALPLFALASLSACAESADHSMHQRPVPTVGRSSTAQPQPPNSLPEGAAVNAPLTSPTGVVATTPVSPAAGTAARRGAP